MNKYAKIALFGFLVWLIPFIASFFFFSSEGVLTIDVRFFKSIMVVVGSATAAVLLISYFSKINDHYLNEGILTGIVWLILSILLDLIVLLPMSRMSLADYFSQIGLGYLAIPIMSIALGMALARKQ
jgi:hypothetical protein